MMYASQPERSIDMSVATCAKSRRGRFGLGGFGLVLILGLACAAPRVDTAQQPGQQAGQQQTTTTRSSAIQTMETLAAQDSVFRRSSNTDRDEEDPLMRERRMKALNAQRQKSMVDDTNKLVELTAQLKDEIGSSHPKALNADQLRRVAEIEKLAKGIREKMSDAIGPTPNALRNGGFVLGPNYP